MRPTFIRLVTGLMLMGSMLLSGTSGMVLCVGEDGHFAVESAYHDHGPCAHDADACGHQDADPSDEEADGHSTGGCDDIPLDIQIASLVAKKLQTDRLSATGPVRPMLSEYDVASALNAAYRLQLSPGKAMPRLSPLLLEKRTIVLRI